MTDAILNTFGEILEEDVPLLTRWMFENRMSVRHKIPAILDWGKKNGDNDLFNYILSKCTPADVRDYLSQQSKKVVNEDGKEVTKWFVSSKQKAMINEWFYGINPQKLQFWYSKYGPPTFKSIFQCTHPKPENWKLPWFQKSIYGGEAPEESQIGKVRKVRKTYTDAKKGVKELLDEGIPWHSISQKWSVSTFIKDYMEHPRIPLRFVIERLSLYRDNPELVELAIQKFKELETPRVPISVIIDEVQKNLTPKSWKPLTLKESELRKVMLDTAQDVLMKTIVDEEYVGKTAIIIDKSGSMNRTIELGITLGGLIAARLGKDQVKLVFFDSVGYSSDRADFAVPETVTDMLYLREKIEGRGNTYILSALTEAMKIADTSEGYDTMFFITDGKIHDGQTYRNQSLPKNKMDLIIECLEALNPKRTFYLKVKSEEDAIPMLDKAFEEYQKSTGSPVITIEADDARDLETILALATYFNNSNLLQKLQNIKGDILTWAEANYHDRKNIEYAVAVKCGNCAAPVPEDIGFCLHCGCMLKISE